MADIDEINDILPSGYSMSVEDISVLMTRKNVSDLEGGVEAIATAVKSDHLQGISQEETLDDYAERKSM